MFRDLLMSLGLLHIEISKDGKRIEYVKGSIEDIKELIEKSKTMSNISAEEIKQEFKELNIYQSDIYDYYIRHNGKDSGNLWIQFSDKLNAFEQRLINASIVNEDKVGGNAFPLKDVLQNLVNASEYLLHKKDYDGKNYEEIESCVKRAKEIIQKLEQNIPIVNERKDSIALIEKSRIEGILTGLKICKEMWAQGTISHENIYENEVYYKEELKNIVK